MPSTTTPTHKVYVLDPYHPDAVELVKSFNDLDVVLPGDARLASWHEDADGIMMRSDSRLTEEDFLKASRLRVVVKQGVGVDNIDLVAAKKHGVAIYNTPALNSESVAELSMALTLSLSRRVTEVDRMVRRGERVIRSQTLSTSMYEKTVGVIGMGNIGKHIATKWKGAFNCHIIGFDPFAPSHAWTDLEHERVDNLEDLLRQADVVTLHVPLLPTTRGLISTEEFEIMKDTAILVNCARGGVVDEIALLEALKEQKIGGVALDTMEIEPPTLKVHGAYLKYDNVILTPHMGGSTKENQSRSGCKVVETLTAVLRGEAAPGKLV